MVSKSPIKNTFINSTIFETQEDIQNRPFEFMTDKLQQISPENVHNKLYEGYLLQIQVSHPQFRFGSASLKLLFETPGCYWNCCCVSVWTLYKIMAVVVIVCVLWICLGEEWQREKRSLRARRKWGSRRRQTVRRRHERKCDFLHAILLRTLWKQNYHVQCKLATSLNSPIRKLD